MILTVHHQSCSYDKPEIRQQIGKQNLGTIRQNGESCLLCLSQFLTVAHFLITLTLSKIVLLQNSAPSIVGWISFSSARAHYLTSSLSSTFHETELHGKWPMWALPLSQSYLRGGIKNCFFLLSVKRRGGLSQSK